MIESEFHFGCILVLQQLNIDPDMLPLQKRAQQDPPTKLFGLLNESKRIKHQSSSFPASEKDADKITSPNLGFFPGDSPH